MKESYVKAIGVGITINLQDISFNVNTKELTVNQVVNDTELYVKGVKFDWHFQETLLDNEHCVCVAYNKPNFTKHNFREISFNELVENSVPLLAADQSFVKSYFSKLDKN